MCIYHNTFTLIASLWFVTLQNESKSAEVSLAMDKMPGMGKCALHYPGGGFNSKKGSGSVGVFGEFCIVLHVFDN